MPLDENDAAALTGMLSAERLGNLVRLTGSTDAAIDLHQETLRLGGDLMAITATIEIAVRNSVCENLSRHFGVPSWFASPPPPFEFREPEQNSVKKAITAARRAEYSKMTQAQKAALDTLAFPSGRPPRLTHQERSKRRREKIQVTDGKIIAEFTLHFWKRLYGPEYEHALWRRTLKRTFPDKGLARADVAANLEVLYQSRNRLAHHEPVLRERFDEMISAVEFVTQRLGQNQPNAQAPLVKLIKDDLSKARDRAQALHNRLNSYKT